jgi:hypothetical protein
LRDNLVSSVARRWANGASTVLVLAGGGLALGLLWVLGYGRGTQRSSVGLVGLGLILAGGVWAEAGLLEQVWPRLLR